MSYDKRNPAINALRKAVARGVAEHGAITEVTPATQFFYEQAGYSWDKESETETEGRFRCARELDEAEQWARRAGVQFRWEWDDCGEYDERGNMMTGCIAELGPDVLASLWGIEDTFDNPDYARVIEAELASDAYALLIDDLGRI